MLLIFGLLITLTAAIITRIRVPWTGNPAALGRMSEAWRASQR